MCGTKWTLCEEDVPLYRIGHWGGQVKDVNGIEVSERMTHDCGDQRCGIGELVGYVRDFRQKSVSDLYHGEI